ncbi:hypothetical protein [Silvanigrella aquatica]|uniref:DNA-binding domain-containing protein n=1 Tax=Silvanigrella aquatica TaxID=1915309 RepID=A0A1L4D1Q8_9BACT|nr:hypothetical protein [Silvanigrella aquatica]APJ04126.1 hypothetical protein AXG55_09500 [Silvanigrella aquatica]
MNFEKLKENQNFFLEIVHSHPCIETMSLLKRPEASIFHATTSHRIQSYRTSYYARISSIFSGTVFQLASCLFGHKLIKNLLIEYFYKNPSALDMIESVRKFPHFLLQRDEIKQSPFIHDFIHLCLGIQDILNAENPNELLLIGNSHKIPSAHEIYLQKDHIYLKSEWPLYQMYCAAKELNETLELKNEFNNIDLIQIEREEKLINIKNKPENLIFLKSNAWSLECIKVPNAFVPIANNLSKGLSLENSINDAEIDEESFDNEKFAQWMALLTQCRALIKI